MYVQRKNVSVTTLVDKIASPLVKSVLEDAIFTPIDTIGRTPKDYAKMLSTGAHPVAVLSAWPQCCYHATWHMIQALHYNAYAMLHLLISDQLPVETIPTSANGNPEIKLTACII